MINEHRKTRISLIDERVTQKNAGARQGCYKVGSVNYYLLRLIKVTLICNAIYKTSRQCSHEEWVTLVVKKLIFLTVALLCIMGTVKTRSMLFACKYHEYNPSLVNKFTSWKGLDIDSLHAFGIHVQPAAFAWYSLVAACKNTLLLFSSLPEIVL
jgi:hypothetical protein